MQSLLEHFKETEGVPSAHTDGKMFYPVMKNGKWVCDSEDGPCEHYQYYNTPCRHILQKQYNNIKNLWNRICEITKDIQETRDMECMCFDEVITCVSFYRSMEVNRLCTLLMNIAILKDSVSSDDLHEATGEQYSDDKIVGVVVGSLLRSKLIECIGRKKTDRKCAHGRSIGIYQLTEKGFKTLERCRKYK